MLILDEKKEILERAKNRMVTAMIYMVAPPEQGKPQDPGTMGLLVEDGKPLIDVRMQGAYVQGAHIWQQQDTCKAKVEERDDVLEVAAEYLKHRRKRVAELNSDDSDVQRATFSSEDIIQKMNGIETQLSLTFDLAAKSIQDMFAAVPFKNLRTHLETLQSKLKDIDGFVVSADIAHGPLMSAFDLYAQDFNRAHGVGRTFRYGDVMLAKGYNLLAATGVPLVTPLKHTLN